jgi:PilZ domain-containing protein
MEQDRSPKRAYRFSAHAELTVENSDAHVTARLYELSREHCRLQVTNPLTLGTSVLVRIYAWPHFFQVHGTVHQSDPNLGVAVAFGEIEPRYVSVLDACLQEMERKESNSLTD